MPSRIADTTPSLLGPVSNLDLDPVIRSLQDKSFDPVDFLNSAIPAFAPSNGPQHSLKPSKIAQVQNTAAHVQSLLAKLNAQHIRYSTTLSQQTDEILRSGSRLAYEVEILRGDANGLYEVLTDTLQDDIRTLGHGRPAIAPENTTSEDIAAEAPPPDPESGSAKGASNSNEPRFISQLRMLSQVKARLEDVINVFGEAMEWPIAPSELSITSSLIIVSAPEPGSDTHTREEKAREAAKRLRSEVTNLLDSDDGGYASIEAAATRVESLRSLMTVWKGTAEEKARTKFVDSLARLIDDRIKLLDARNDPGTKGTGTPSQRSISMPGRPSPSNIRADRNANDGSSQAGGLLRNLQRLRDDFYLD